MLCGHHLVDRLEKGEEIFFFCFYVLKYIMDDEFSIVGQRWAGFVCGIAKNTLSLCVSPVP